MQYLPFVLVVLFSALVLFVLARFSKLDLDTALKIGGGLATVLSVAVGVIEFTTGQREQAASAAQTEYITATQLLTEPGSSKPMAGIAALAQLAEHDSERTWLMTESLSAFVRFKAPRPDEDGQLSSARSQLTQAPYEDPPCSEDSASLLEPPLEAPFIYSSCTSVRNLSRSNPSVQTAIAAIASRNRQNETEQNAPERFKSQLISANNGLLKESQRARESILGTIAEWHSDMRLHKPLESNRQLLQENQEGIFSAYPHVMRRPWLDLSSSELAGLDASSGFMEGGNLSRSDLSFGLLPGAHLAKVDLSGSWLVGSDLFRADLRGADLQDADARGADLGRADLRESWMSGATFHRANFWQADLSKAYLIAADLTELQTMSGARLDDVIAYRADFSRAKIKGKEGSRVSMRRAFLEEAKLQCTILRGIDLRGANLEDADLTNADLLGADLRQAHFAGTIVTGANLSGTDLRGVDFTQSIGTPASIEGAIIDQKTKVPWANGKTVMKHDLLGFEFMWNVHDLPNYLGGPPPRTLAQMREVCPPQANAQADFSTKLPHAQQSPVSGDVTLEIASEPTGGEITLDGESVGSTPTSIKTSSGEHTLKLSKAGYFVWERKFKVARGDVRISPELELITGSEQ